MKRQIDLVRKAWLYLLTGLERPANLPKLGWLVTARGVHAGEFLTLQRHARWLQAAGIRTVIDVGANTGQFATAIRALLPSAHLHCFEPLPDCFDRLMGRFSRDPHFSGYCAALGDRTEEVMFWRSAFAESSSVLEMSELHKRAFPWTASQIPTRVPMRRLDDYVEDMRLEPSVLLKVDVQGYELGVLRGASHVLECADLVLIETSYSTLYRGQASFADVYDYLVNHGFAFKGSLAQLASPLDGSPLQGDLLFMRTRQGCAHP